MQRDRETQGAAACPRTRCRFARRGMSPEELEYRCIQARRTFYGWPSILGRAKAAVNRRDPWMLLNFLAINAMHRADVVGRNHMPLGDESWTGTLLPVA